ncbi:MAG: sulfotransferase [Anaerolineae bacterium]|nr:sulfotransferase [Anaerolineae bacterium]
MSEKTITIVSGLPRSGTSMMMKMLQAGGMAILTDRVRTADDDNPKGYYEFERVKQLETDQSWLPDAQGQAVKVITALLRHLPPGYRYKVIFMRRQMEEILASQRQMLINRGEPTDRVDDQKLASMFRRHVVQTEAWLAAQPNLEALYVHYSAVLADPPGQAARLNEFLGQTLDEEAMARAVDPGLYRQRA